MRSLSIMALLTGMLALAQLGCGARREYQVAGLDVERSGWDTIRVVPAFAWRTTLGRLHPVTADNVVVTIFDARYDTLYTGEDGSIVLPDAALGDEERLLLEVCGDVQRFQICQQSVIRASPKRITLDEHIDYPEDAQYERGSYDFHFNVERLRYGGDDWERVEDVDGIEGYMLAWVNDQRDGTVKIPFSRKRGRFDLKGHEHYKDFKYFLDSQLLDDRSARVRFDVYGGINGQPVQLASVEKEVRVKSRDERLVEVRYYAEQAVERIVDELGAFLGGRRAVAYVDNWAFDDLTHTYTIDLNVTWRGAFYRDDRFELEGTLSVGEDGSDATFTRRRSNRVAYRRWDDRLDGERLDLGSLQTMDREEMDRRLADRQETGRWWR